jgi:short-subunit dehydrogenase
MDDALNYALVTGASSGIGRSISEELAKRGYNIVAVSNQPSQLDDLKKNIELSFPVRVIIMNIDLAQENSASELFGLCKKQNIIVGVLVNNAGIFAFGEAVKVDYSALRSMLVLHTVTPVLLCRLFGEPMASNRKGYILNISSITAVMPYPGISLYGPTKVFLRHFTRALRTEMKLYGVNVTCLLPGAVATSLYGSEKFNSPTLRMFGLMKKPESVAKTGVNALFKNRPECIPGFITKVIVFLLPLVPHSIISLIYRKYVFSSKTRY